MPFILLIAAACLLVWGTYMAWRGSLIIGCVIFVIMTTCFSNEFLRLDVGGTTWTLDRLYLIGLLAAVVVQWRTGKFSVHRPRGVELLMGLLFAILVVSALSHEWRANLPGQVSIVMRLINGFAIPFVIFWIARNAALREPTAFRVYVIIGVFGIYLVVTGLFEVTGQWQFVFPRYISNPNLSIHFGRARGPALQAVINGVVMAVSLIVMWLSWGWTGRAGRRGQLAAILLVPLFAAGIFCTYTRSVWLGVGVAGCVILAATLSFKWRPVVLVGLASLALLVGITQWDRLIGFQREGSAAQTRESTYMRASFAYVSWEIFKDYPIFGCGFGQFSRVNQTYLTDHSTDLRLESIRGYVHHNTFLCVLTETGVVGFGVYVAMLGGWIRCGWALWQKKSAPRWVRAHGLMLSSTVLLFTVQMVFHDVTYSPVDNSLIMLLVGMGVNLQSKFVVANKTAGNDAQQSVRTPFDLAQGPTQCRDESIGICVSGELANTTYESQTEYEWVQQPKVLHGDAYH
jgi:O-antigen ligase